MGTMESNFDAVGVIERQVSQGGEDGAKQTGTIRRAFTVGSRNGNKELKHYGDQIQIFELGEDVLVLSTRDRLEAHEDPRPDRLRLSAGHKPD